MTKIDIKEGLPEGLGEIFAGLDDRISELQARQRLHHDIGGDLQYPDESAWVIHHCASLRNEGLNEQKFPLSQRDRQKATQNLYAFLDRTLPVWQSAVPKNGLSLKDGEHIYHFKADDLGTVILLDGQKFLHAASSLSPQDTFGGIIVGSMPHFTFAGPTARNTFATAVEFKIHTFNHPEDRERLIKDHSLQQRIHEQTQQKWAHVEQTVGPDAKILLQGVHLYHNPDSSVAIGSPSTPRLEAIPFIVSGALKKP